MAINKINNGDGTTTVRFSYTATSTKVANTLADAAKYLYDKVEGHGVELADNKTVDDLTNNEIGQIVDYYVKFVLKNAAKSYYIEETLTESKQTAENEAGNKHI